MFVDRGHLTKWHMPACMQVVFCSTALSEELHPAKLDQQCLLAKCNHSMQANIQSRQVTEQLQVLAYGWLLDQTARTVLVACFCRHVAVQTWLIFAVCLGHYDHRYFSSFCRCNQTVKLGCHEQAQQRCCNGSDMQDSWIRSWLHRAYRKAATTLQ